MNRDRGLKRTMLVLSIIGAIVAAYLWRHAAVRMLEDSESRLADLRDLDYGEIMGFDLRDQWNAATTKAEHESLWAAWTKWRVPAEIVWQKQHKELNAVPPSEIIGSTLAIEELPYLDAYGWHTVVGGEPLTLAPREVSHIRHLIETEPLEETIRKDRRRVVVATEACLLVVIVPLAIFWLLRRDRGRWGKRDKARPAEERIDEIRG
jgi:hypothetical protein